MTGRLVILAALATSFTGLCEKGDFRCPEEFGYYAHPSDCSLYYVCVFGGPLLESCTGGLVYSHDLQTCDWPRNVACSSNLDNSILGDQALQTAVAIDSKKDEKTKSNRTPRKQNNKKKDAFNSIPPPREEIIEEEEEEKEELLGLSPLPSILSTTLHGANNNRNSLKSKKQQQRQEVDEIQDKIDIIEPIEDELLLPALNFGDKNFGQDRATHGSDSDSASLNSSDIEKTLLASYPGVSPVLDDSQDQDPIDSFYYVNWDNPIYDQYDDFGNRLPVEDDGDNDKDPNLGSVWIEHEAPQRPSAANNQGPRPGDPATSCTKEKCSLPDCRCGGSDTPGNITKRNTPQLVILTFDDSVNDLNKRLYQDIFHPSRKNPNGCPISATFYVSHEWTDYGLVQSLYSDGHEIASHSISHSFGEQFSTKKWIKEMAGQREILAGFAGVNLEDVRGIRAPFLAIGGNNMFSMLYEANFTYDSSMPIYENRPPSFPYTMDYKIHHDCMIPPCPNKAFPGVWEIPLVMWNDLKDGRCSMADACSNPSTAQGVYYMIMKNFQRHYNTNRAPFGLSYHPAWFTTPHHKEGFELFLDTIVSMEDVWIVSAWQSIQWMRDPTPLQDINSFKPFQCEYKERPPRCDKPKVCNLWHKSGVRYMRTCQECPDIYPWTGRTGIANSRVDNLK